ncbi:hypothetical protein [Lacisediminihabitans profunda]|uniref:Uncharacterized protein n=1 Tax=Lacisediminihabitans profunda TaxID=2594790 RepID=A0A5C8USD4_9MICO|nr:hypothetical protein [Lacisediminihabitans profunda]TXN31455.1 hypothetical protein FVP33_07875 [Lacisediminihabitans profunda]
MPSEPTQDTTPDDQSAPSGQAGYAGNPPVQGSRPRRGLVLAGAIVGAVVVLGATFGGGVLVGSATHVDGPSMRQADRAPGNGQRGDRPDHGFMGPRGDQRGSNDGGYPGN